ncbi:hypothetical protein TNIN_320391 [Trichonephila inaurata madagascariensis]|uniref:Uncharacterized protein n=1 Tax=Trichonephila inaurata madagascariensis TaxID=2747483 RepID=A0A8X6YEG2_9ARAC|nr:hypothetical protein TNIN_320391 [Trichonephila inaurata madagascariensis]
MRTAQRPDRGALRSFVCNVKGLSPLQSFLVGVCSCGCLNVKCVSALRNGAENESEILPSYCNVCYTVPHAATGYVLISPSLFP